MQRLRPTFIAIAILALSATAVLAAEPARPAFAPGSHQPEASESAEPSRSLEAGESPQAGKSAEASKSPQAGESAEAGHPVNHGCVVSLAARTATPSGFKNHGQWVSSIAKDNHGRSKSDDTKTCTLPASSPAPSGSLSRP
jgi:hypothetical protein